MLNMLRAELFRIVRTRIFLAFVVCFCLFALATPIALLLYRVWPAFAETGFVEVPDGPLPTLRLYGTSFVAGSFLSMGASVMMAAFVTEDFKSGFVKNLAQARHGRTAYAAAAVGCGVLVSLAATAAGMLLVEAALRAQGCELAPCAPGETLQWFLQTALCTAAYASIAVFVTVLIGNETASVLVALLFGGGAVESVLRIALANVPGVPVGVRDCLDGYLAVDLASLSAGAVTDPVTYVQAVVTVGVAAALAVAVMRRKSL